MPDAIRHDGADLFQVEIARDIDAVLRDWELLEKDAVLTPFQTRAWLVPFYRELAPRLKAAPFFVLVRNKEDRSPALLLPLCARRYFGITIVQFADLGVSDYNAPILARGFNPSPGQWLALWRRILAAIDLGWVMRLRNMPPKIGGRPNPLLFDKNLARPADVAAWGLALPPTADNYRKGVLLPTLAKDLAMRLRRVARRGAMEFVVLQTAEERLPAFEILARQRQARCDETGRFNILSQDAYRSFYRAAIVDTSDALASLALLKIGGEPVAAIFGLVHNNAYHQIMHTFESGEWKRYSLGNVLLLTTIERCIADGVAYFDMTMGDEDYKRLFGARPTPLYSVSLPLTPLAAPLASALEIAIKVRRTLRRRRERARLYKRNLASRPPKS